MSAEEHESDITERLEDVASVSLEHSELLREALAEIERLREELKKEMFSTRIRYLRRTK